MTLALLKAFKCCSRIHSKIVEKIFEKGRIIECMEILKKLLKEFD